MGYSYYITSNSSQEEKKTEKLGKDGYNFYIINKLTNLHPILLRD